MFVYVGYGYVYRAREHIEQINENEYCSKIYFVFVFLDHFEREKKK